MTNSLQPKLTLHFFSCCCLFVEEKTVSLFTLESQSHRRLSKKKKKKKIYDENEEVEVAESILGELRKRRHTHTRGGKNHSCTEEKSNRKQKNKMSKNKTRELKNE